MTFHVTNTTNRAPLQHAHTPATDEENPSLRSFRPIVSAGAAGATLSANVGARWTTDRLVYQRLYADLSATGGGRVIPVDLSSPDPFEGNVGVTVYGQGTVEAALFPQGALRIAVRDRIVRDVRRGYQSLEHRVAPGATWQWGASKAGLLWAFDRSDYHASEGQQAVHRRWFGPSRPLHPHVSLQYPQLTFLLDTLDRRADPRHGVHLDIDLRPWIPTQDTYATRGVVDLRGFLALHPDAWTLALRVRGGSTTQADGSPVRALSLRHHLGGPSDMRGWTWRNVSPPGALSSPGDVRAGGDTLAFASITSRHRPHPDVTIGPFLDLGRVWEVAHRDVTPELSDLVGSVGLEVAGASPVGDVRGSVSYNPWLPDDISHTPPAWMWQIGLGSPF